MNKRIKKKKRKKYIVSFKAVLQSFGIRNRNQRVYDAASFMNKIEHSDYISNISNIDDHPKDIDTYIKAFANELFTETHNHSFDLGPDDIDKQLDIKIK